MNSHFAHAIRLSVAGLCVACGLARGGVRARAQEAAANVPAPGYTQALQAEFPERKLPSLQEILRRGLLDGPAILMSEWNAAAAAQDARGSGRAPMLPRVWGAASAGQTYEQYQNGGASTNRSLVALLYSLNFYQPVYAWDTLTNNYKILEMRQAMSERNIAETRRLLAIEIRRRYFDIIITASALDLARKNLERSERAYKETEQQIKDGSLAPAALAGPDIAIQNAKPDIMRLENELAALKQTLVRITGLPEAAIDNIPAEIPALPELRDALHALSGGAAPPPSAQLQNLSDEAGIAKLNYAIAKKRLYPSLGVNLAVSQENRTPNNTAEGPRYLITTWGAYASVNWTMFDGFATQAAKRALLERMKIAEAARSQARRQEDAERRMEIARLQVQWEQLRNTERDLAIARGGMEITEQDYKNGTASARQVEDARMGYLTALQNPYGAYAARANFYIALVTCLSNRGQDPVIMAMQQ